MLGSARGAAAAGCVCCPPVPAPAPTPALHCTVAHPLPPQLLYDDFQTDVEDRARAAGVRVRLAKQLTELEKQFYGSSMAYDRAMAHAGGNETLETVRWRWARAEQHQGRAIPCLQ